MNGGKLDFRYVRLVIHIGYGTFKFKPPPLLWNILDPPLYTF